MKRWRKPVVFLLATYLVCSAIVGVLLTEFSLKRLRRPLPEQFVAMFRDRVAKHNASYRDVTVKTTDGLTMHGWYVTPAKPNGSTVILFHGVTDNRLGVAGFGDLFLNKGYSLILPDARAHGESDGEIATYGVLEANDVARWVDLAYSEQPNGCVYGFGESMGAGIVMQSLRVEKRFCAVVEESGFAEFREAAYDRLGEKMDVGPWFGMTLMRPAIEVGIIYARMKFGVSLSDASSRRAVAQSNTPVLLIHGDADKNIRPRNADLIHKAAPTNTELWKVPGAAHCGAWAAQHQEFDRRVLGFLANHTTRCDLGGCRL